MEIELNRRMTIDGLPERLGVLFRSLRTGKHICRDDVLDFRDLNGNEDALRTLFKALGYELMRHPGHGFFYFKGENLAPTSRMQAVTLFMLILFQDLEDKKFQTADRAWERMLLSRTFHVNELPHFATSQRRTIMGTVGVTSESLGEKIFRPLVRMGMIEMVSAEQFQFRSPVFRFVDLCIQYADQDLATSIGDDIDSVVPSVDGADEGEGGRES
jgi:hypothetical protein